MNEDEDAQDRAQEFSRAPDGYIRKSTLLQTVGALVGILGAFLGLVGLFNSFREYVDRRVDNERTERINEDHRIWDEVRRRRR